MNHEQDQGKGALPLATPERDAPLPHPFAEAVEAEPFFAFDDADGPASDAPISGDAPTLSATDIAPLPFNQSTEQQLPPAYATKAPNVERQSAAGRIRTSSGASAASAPRSAPLERPLADGTTTESSGAQAAPEANTAAPRTAGSTKRKLIGFLQASAALSGALLMRGALGDASHGAQTIGVGVTLGGSFLFLYALMQFIAGKDVTYPKADVILRGGSFAVIGVAAIVTLSRWTTPAAAPEPVAAAAGTADLTAKAAEAAAKAAQTAARAETERQIAKLRDDLKTSVGGNAEVEAIRKELNAYIAANNERLHSLEEVRSAKTRQATSTLTQPEATKGLQALKTAQSLRERAKSEPPERALSLLTEARLRLKEAEIALKEAGLPGKLAEARLSLAETLDELAGDRDSTSPERCPIGAAATAWRARETAEAYALASTPEARKAAPVVAAAALNGKGKSLFITRAYTEAADAFYESAALFRENGMMAEAGVAERNRGESLNALSYCPKDNAEKIVLLKKALQSYEGAALYFEAAGDTAALTAVQSRLSLAFKRMGDMADSPAKKELYAKAQEALSAAGRTTLAQQNQPATPHGTEGQAELLAAKADPAHEAAKTAH